MPGAGKCRVGANSNDLKRLFESFHMPANGGERTASLNARSAEIDQIVMLMFTDHCASPSDAMAMTWRS